MAKDFRTLPNLSSYPPGIRNNNPGNIRPSDDNWQGMAGTANNFVVFKDLSWGIRAMGTDLTNKINGGYDTIAKLITRYAPPSENDTQAYINNVVRFTGIPQDQPLSHDLATLKSLMKAQMSVELGGSASMITDADINEGLAKMSTSIIAKIKNFFLITRT